MSPQKSEFQVSPLVLFGGSFDPIHEGHIHLAKRFCDELPTERFFFVPARQNPLKKGAPSAASADRLEMARLSLKEVNDPKLEVLDWEILPSASPVSFTITTVERFLSLYGKHPTLVMGNEVFQTLPAWKDPKRLLTLADCVVVTRDLIKVDYEKVLTKLGIAIKIENEGALKSDSNRIFKTLSIAPLPYSSTHLRADIQKRWESNNLSVSPRGIQRSVWQFIKAKRLYAVTE